LLERAELESGLSRFHEDHPGPDEILHYRLWYRGIMGRKPAAG